MDALKKESEIQTAICKYLDSKSFLFFRVNNTPIWDKNLRNGYGSYRSQGKWAAAGLPDIIVVLKVGFFSAFIGLEVKTTTGRQTADQLLFEKRVKKNNGFYFVVRSVNDVEEAVKKTHEEMLRRM